MATDEYRGRIRRVTVPGSARSRTDALRTVRGGTARVCAEHGQGGERADTAQDSFLFGER
ncbi:hypothetical protein GCM10009602_67250 [Nocardiopsis tropica]